MQQQKAAHHQCALVLDLEATCDEDGPLPFPREILQIAVVVHAPYGPLSFLHGQQFDQLVLPSRLEGITPFCQQLTGITPERVLAEGVPFEVAHGRLVGWLIALGLLMPVRTDKKRTSLLKCHNWAFATYGSCDLGEMWPEQCALSGIRVSPWFRSWIDVGKMFETCTRRYRLVSLKQAARSLLCDGTDDAHDALADARVCAAVLFALENMGYRDYPIRVARLFPVPVQVPVPVPAAIWLPTKKTMLKEDGEVGDG